ncbi:hypothetical protein LQ063_08155 [Enterococcus hirae]|uniref:hypothetical protein n=1 Tax=Enterococcus hirae TaxID=1354 RepID=UPI002018DBA4|nr:hypothetical protein [Enterococcus hirae]UQR02727.1 hypothetical protein LQ063_08155 [Enterococcus hirae]
MKIDGRLKKSNEEIVKTYVYYLNLIFKQASSVPFKIKQSSNVTELIITYDKLDYKFRDYSKADVVRACRNRTFIDNKQLDDYIKELSKFKAEQIAKDYKKFLNTVISSTEISENKELFIQNLSEALEINKKYLANKYKINIDYEIIYLANKYVHFECKVLEALDNIIPDLTLSDEQSELMYKKNDDRAVETVSTAIYNWIMDNLKTTTKIALANQDDLKDMLDVFKNITKAKSVKLSRDKGNFIINYDNKVSDKFILISSDPVYIKSLII